MPVIRLTRATRFLPKVRGAGRIVWPLVSLYRPFIDEQRLYRISNFDGNLLLDVRPTDTIGAALWHIPQLWERHERRLFCDAIRPGCTVLDVGANIGVYTLLAAKRGAHVFAIEADPQNAAMLRHHLSINGLSAQVFEVAASDKPGRVSLRRNPNNCGGSVVIAGSDITASTIDSLALPPIDVCKMDIEGSEYSALLGMPETLSRSPALTMLIESNPLSDQAALMALLKTHFTNINPVGQENLWCWNY